MPDFDPATQRQRLRALRAPSPTLEHLPLLVAHHDLYPLRHRQLQAEADAGTRNDRLTSGERERLRELEREVRELRKANEILRAASVFFAKELDGTPRR